MQWVESFALSCGISNRLAMGLANAADEMFTNAVIDAPQEASPQVPRSGTGAERSVEIKIGAREGWVGISTVDQYGSLSPKRLLSYLAKCYRGGPDQISPNPMRAGLGMYLTLETLSQLIVNVSPGKRTEVIGILRPADNFRNFMSQSKSFHVFVDQ